MSEQNQQKPEEVSLDKLNAANGAPSSSRAPSATDRPKLRHRPSPLASTSDNFGASPHVMSPKMEKEKDGHTGKPPEKLIKHQQMYQAMESLIGTLSSNQNTLEKLVEIIYREKEDHEAKKEKERQNEQNQQNQQKPGELGTIAEHAENEKQDFPEKSAEEPPVEQRHVYTRIIFLKVNEVDSMRMFFTANIFLQARWHEPELDEVPEGELDATFGDGSMYWNPELVIDNIRNDKTKKNYSTKRDAEKKTWVIEKRNINAEFLQVMNLVQFPMDTQPLDVILMSDLHAEEVQFHVDEEEVSGVNVETFGDTQEWELYKLLKYRTLDIPDAHSNEGKQHPAIAFTIRVGRLSGYFYWNIFFTMALITGLSFCMFAVQVFASGGIEQRMRLGFTLILTAITFRNSSSKTLPPLCYLSNMDKFLFLNLFFLFLANVWHCVAYYFWFNAYITLTKAADINNLQSLWQGYENYVLYVLGGIWVSMNITLVVWISFMNFTRYQYRKGIDVQEANNPGYIIRQVKRE